MVSGENRPIDFLEVEQRVKVVFDIFQYPFEKQKFLAWSLPVIMEENCFPLMNKYAFALLCALTAALRTHKPRLKRDTLTL